MTNPFKTTERAVTSAVNLSRPKLAVVTSTPVQSEDGVYHCEVTNHRHPSGVMARIHADVHQSLYLPTEGSVVLINDVGGGEIAIVSSYYHTESPIPLLNPGEHQEGHPVTDAHVLFNQNGTVQLHSPTVQYDTAVSTRKDPITDRASLDVKRDGKVYAKSEAVTATNEQTITEAEITTKPSGDIVLEGEHVQNNTWSKMTMKPDGTVLLEAIDDGTTQSSVECKPDGTTVVESNAGGSTVKSKPNGDVVINEGSIAAVTDVRITATDQNGGATELTLDRNDTVLVPSGNTTTTSS